MPSPGRANHGESHASVLVWLGSHHAATPGTRLGDNATVRLDLDNEVQLDAFLRLEPSLGGRSRVSDDGYIEGPPELVVEVAPSSASYDLHDKRHVYRRNGGQEYLVWQLQEERTDWFALDEGA